WGPLPAQVFVDGRGFAELVADGRRPDVGQAYPAAGGSHGFTWSGTLSPGAHQVCVYAINQGAGSGNPRLGCRTVTVS
ncbi:hypothetical protein ACQ1ZK_20020, partial [Enterococcus faecium]